MNNKEAKKLIEYMLNRDSEGLTTPHDIEKGREALSCAINALEERPHGEWINQSQGSKYPCECSECHTEPFCNDDGYVLSNFCPTCGAEMTDENT